MTTRARLHAGAPPSSACPTRANSPCRWALINDTFETAITWDRFEAFHAAVRKATEEALKEATGQDGTVSTRFTHVYPDGPAVYYTFNVRGEPGRLIEQWRHIKTRASDALIAAGGTITHHHAVGRDHMPWYRAQRPALFGRRSRRRKAPSTRRGS